MGLSDRAGGGSVMNLTDEHLRRFLVRYGEALSSGDLKAISGCYAVPSLVLSDTGSVPIAAREEIEAAFDGAAERYRAQGLVAVRPTLVASEDLSERLVSVDVRWDYLDEQGRSAQQNCYRYVLRLEDEASPKIQVVIGTR
jgi:ketosteroid isomerase-like protein